MTNTPSIALQPTTTADLESLFVFQLDEEAIHQAAFTPLHPHDKEAYLAKYTRLLSDPSINMHTIRVGGAIVGSIAKFEMEGDAEITYWLDRRFWGQGIASAALRAFLDLETTRPLFGRTAYDNTGSQRVLEKAGFQKTGTDRGFANARQAEIEEFIFRLD